MGRYPGVELFRGYKDKRYEADRLFFDWTMSEVNAELSLPRLGRTMVGGGKRAGIGRGRGGSIRRAVTAGH